MEKSSLASRLAKITTAGLLAVVPMQHAVARDHFFIRGGIGLPVGVVAPVVAPVVAQPAGYYTIEMRRVFIGYGAHGERIFQDQQIRVFHPAPVMMVAPAPAIGIGAHVGHFGFGVHIGL